MLFPEQRGDKRMTSFLRQLAERDSRGPPPAWPGSISLAVPSCGGLSRPPASLSSWSQGQKMFMNVASVCLPGPSDFVRWGRKYWHVWRCLRPLIVKERSGVGVCFVFSPQKRQVLTKGFKQRANYGDF